MAPPLKLVFAAAILAVALPRLKAWATGQWYCNRLVPLSIVLASEMFVPEQRHFFLPKKGAGFVIKTSVATPCTFPCLLVSPHYGHYGIVVRQEADGTPCKAFRSRLEVYQESECRNGICQLSDLWPHLKADEEGSHLQPQAESFG
uniref:Putative conserved secreted protein n=1 Tax=Rhipicephalus microplus TaxID=6941 RepID=A0A6G5A389_RHIMP